MTPLLFLLSILGLLPIFVSAHGYLKSVTIDGKVYSGNQPGGTTNPSAIRQVSHLAQTVHMVLDIFPHAGVNNIARQRLDQPIHKLWHERDLSFRCCQC